MSLPLDTLQELQKPLNVDKVAGQLIMHSLQSSVAALPEGVRIVNLEGYKKFKDHYKFAFETSSISDFGRYCAEFAKEGSKCFINEKIMKAKTEFDLGSEFEPLHQLHNATLTLKKTAAFQALESVVDHRFSQKDAANFIEDWEDFIVISSSDGEVMTANQAAVRLRNITIEQINNRENKEGDFYSTESSFEKIEAKNNNTIPNNIIFTCQPYRGLAYRAFDVKLSILTGGEKPQISLRIVRLEQNQEAMADEFKEIIIALFANSEGLKTFIGQ